MCFSLRLNPNIPKLTRVSPVYNLFKIYDFVIQDRLGERTDYEFALTPLSDTDNSNVMSFVSQVANACAFSSSVLQQEDASIEETDSTDNEVVQHGVEGGENEADDTSTDNGADDGDEGGSEAMDIQEEDVSIIDEETYESEKVCAEGNGELVIPVVVDYSETTQELMGTLNHSTVSYFSSPNALLEASLSEISQESKKEVFPSRFSNMVY